MNNPFQRDTPLPSDPVGRAVALLQALPEESRTRVLEHLSEEHRAAVEAKLRPHREFSESIVRGSGMADHRRLLREAVMSMHNREAERVNQSNEYSSLGGSTEQERSPQAPLDPLDHLRDLHPAALAKAMQGERAEAWALVLGRLSDTSRSVLLSFIDEHARNAITRAEREQASLPDALRRTAERALRHTVVPRALREQQLLMSTPMSTMRSPSTS